MKTACLGRCCTCPIGANCQDEALLPITLADLPILPGYYRLSSDQIDVRRCPDAATNCPSGQSACGNSTSACRGGRDFDAICRPGLNGTFCRACATPSSYYVSAKSGRVARCELCEDALPNGLKSSFGILAIVSGVVVLAGAIYMGFKRGNRRERLPKWLHNLWAAAIYTYRLPDQIKILIGFFQIASRVENVYEIYLPADVRSLLQHLRISISLGIEGVPLSCVGADGYVNRLAFWMWAPILLVGFAAVCVSVHVLLTCRLPLTLMVSHRPHAAAPSVQNGTSLMLAANASQRRLFLFAERMMAIILRIAFLTYPIVTQIAFEAFSCFTFEDGTGFLIADVLIECNTPRHTHAKALASVAILIYPVGLFVLNAVLLYNVRAAIRSGKRTRLSRTLFFLHREYAVDYFWWYLDRDSNPVSCLTPPSHNAVA